ncbi:hypothetical protein [Flavobacterium sp. GT3R68]|uniref:hypothetical protein n=1 Tax=Flavobacterium sp. GT3R68 TaxID=2594437 RepID=UPI000F88E275|nr:hypothetical protein [Flavobacterium sp. GT3R68]RTY93436.1 hypothetical protein EKL32_16425 [Flavobacterium sp. GSN2]TRW92391.1 hypothetical protein FNW07_05115 [Flavobacterium sp. GT3R68]
MDNHDKIFEQFKTASHKAETKDFPAMDKVWSRIDGKLDRTQIKKETKLWKKVAVAASLLLVASVGYQFLKSDPENIPNQNVVIIDSTQTVIPSPILENNAIVANETKNAIIKEDANQILEEQMISQPDVASVEIVPAAESIADTEYDKRAENLEEKSSASFVAKKNTNDIVRGRNYEAVSVQHNQMEIQTMDSEPAPKTAAKTNAPLVVIDGKADKKGLSKLKDDNIESIVELKEPLYIINGVPYSEKELFGKNPTSPYAPLDQQEIEKTIVLQGEEAIARYGDKGKNGVLIITTKNGKPAKTPK